MAMDGLWDERILDRIVQDFPKPDQRDWIKWDTGTELKQTSRGIAGLSPVTQLFLLHLCSEPFVNMLRELTGINDLVPDPTFFGAGLHECFRDGWLDIHGDYIRHPHLPLARRLNLLIYLNRDWDPQWGGDLELWDPATKSLAVKFAPKFNRTVLFTTTTDALHGHPHRLACPDTRSRKLISVYYWSTDQALLDNAQEINFIGNQAGRPRLGWKSFVPPIVRTLRGRLRGIGSSMGPRMWLPPAVFQWKTVLRDRLKSRL
jgi:hypothetical protein